MGKITDKEGMRFVGVAKCYDSEEVFIDALERGKIKKREKTGAIIRYEDPKSGPGMPEMLKPSSAIMAQDSAMMLPCSRMDGSLAEVMGS